jgi:stalled ribosome rescue protein Dom34
MKKNKCLAIWMDHSNAYLMDLSSEPIVTSTIVSEAITEEVEYSSDKHEKIIHKKEQHQQLSFFKKLGETIKKYEDVLLFGPTNAKNELLNLLKSNRLYEKIKIEMKNADKMTESQMHAFVRGYFK